MHEELIYRIGVTLIPGIGDVLAKKLIAYCGGAKEVFEKKPAALKKTPGIGSKLAQEIIKQDVLKRAEEEVKFIEKYRIQPLYFAENDYPERLKNCTDSPVLLYSKGSFDFNKGKFISIVGTRSATAYGKEFCEKLIEKLVDRQVHIVSGLAYGIDIAAHKSALKNGLPTIAVLAHGLDRIYPQNHSKAAKQMLEKGALITDYMSQTNPDRENFPKRNRLIAGLSDATIVVEAGKRGGALITAELANSYNRDVFAVPGRVGDLQSEGCNWLINRNKAALLNSAEELLYMMGWDEQEKSKKPIQKQLFIELKPDEKSLVEILSKNGATSIDALSLKANMPISNVSMALLNMEMQGIIKAQPGKVFKLA